MKIKSFLAGLILGALAIIPFAALAQQILIFSDVPDTHPNYTAIKFLKDRGIISGYPDGTFKPDQPVNRVEALKIITLGAGLDPLPMQPGMDVPIADFSDINQSGWYMPYLNRAVENGIVQGYDDGTFKPDTTVNLAENLKMLLLSNDIDISTISVTQNPYADTPKDAWYAPYVQYAKDKNLIDADDQNKVYPGQGMTRGKLAETMYRLIYLKEHGQDTFIPPLPTQQETQAMKVTIANSAFKAKELTVAIGTTVQWKNTDAMAHTVTSDDGKTMNSTSLSQNETYEYTFNETGTFPYHCAIHPSMTGTVIVKPVDEVPTI